MRRNPEISENSAIYDHNFYENQNGRPLQSARRYLGHLWNTLQPKSVLDVGCGRGAWLKSCHELGATRLLGLDGDWNSQSLMIDDAIEFRSIDLNTPFSVPKKVELTICVEVAEHLQPKTAPQFIQSLTGTSDAVLFSAAYLNQGGTNHINEQQHSYWAKLFAAYDFSPFDFFRPVFWGDEDIDFWYRQNVFLYVRKDSSEWRTITNSGYKAMSSLDFMNCIHPDLLRNHLSFRSHLRALGPSFVRGMRRRFLGRSEHSR
jgi:SAM-dependent methyltransferase